VKPNVEFKDVDNRGGWDLFMFRPKFLNKDRKATKLMHCSLPCGATPVPANTGGKRLNNGFKFHYNGWTRDEADPVARIVASHDNMFPAYQKGRPDGKLLAKLGLNKERMLDQDDCAPDALFFYQLLFPIHDDKTKHTIQGDAKNHFALMSRSAWRCMLQWT